MRTLGILAFILTATVRNRIRSQFRRMKNPRYLIATLFGLAYFWFFIGRRVFASGTVPPLDSDMRVILANAGALLAVPLAALQWLFGRERASLTFSEAEIQFLFAGPVSRSSLVLYRIARTLLLVFLSALVAAFFFGARVTGHAGFFILGFWAVLSAMSLHQMVASLMRHALFLRGVRGVVRTGAVVIVVAAVLGGLGYASLRSLPLSEIPRHPTLETVGDWARRFQETPLGTALRPLRAPLELALAEDLHGFLSALPFAAGLIGVLAYGVLRSDVAFEEASVEAAEKRAKQIEQRRGRRAPVAGSPGRSFRLSAHGRPEWAIGWKGVVAARRLLIPQVLGLLVPLVLMTVVIAVVVGRSEGMGSALGTAAAGLAICSGALVLLGPNVVRSDLRMDMKQIEILRTWPITGAQIVAGELLGSLGLLTLLEWVMLAAAFVVSVPVQVAGFPLAVRFAVALSAAILAPLVTLCGLLVQNAAVLLFPSWMSQGLEQPRGFEATGQRLLTFAGGLVVWAVGLLPAALLGGGVLLVVSFTLGPLGAPVAAIAAAMVLAFEAYLAVRLLGRWFDRVDASSEA